MTKTAITAWLREYVTMANALAVARSRSDVADARVALRMSRQKREASETLFLGGSTAEAARLAVEAFDAIVRAAMEVHEALPRSALVRLEAAKRCKSSLVDLKDDGSSTADQQRSLRELLSLELSLEAALSIRFLLPKEILKLRLQRWVLLLLVIAAPIALVRFAIYVRFGMSIRASSELDEQYTADRAIDGDPDTVWAAKGGGQEWLEIRFRPRSIHTLRMLNGDLLPDRATKDVRVEFYLGDEVFPAGVQSFQQTTPAQWVTYDVSGLRADRIRIVMLSHYGAAPSIAEIEVQ